MNGCTYTLAQHRAASKPMLKVGPMEHLRSVSSGRQGLLVVSILAVDN